MLPTTCTVNKSAKRDCNLDEIFNGAWKDKFKPTSNIITNIDIEFPTPIVVAANSNAFIKIDKSVPSQYEVFAFITKCIYVFMVKTISKNNPSVYMPEVLIDEDYPANDVIFSFVNPTDVDVTIGSWTVTINGTQYSKIPVAPVPLYNYPAFNYQQLTPFITYTKIKNFLQSTTRANGLDLYIDKKLKIQPKGILELYFPLDYTHHNRPLSFMLRSRYARSSLEINYHSIDNNTIRLTIINRQKRGIAFDNRFLVFIPEGLFAARPQEIETPVMGLDTAGEPIPIFVRNITEKAPKGVPKIKYF
jgi:hypothetical protein